MSSPLAAIELAPEMVPLKSAEMRRSSTPVAVTVSRYWSVSILFSPPPLKMTCSIFSKIPVKSLLRITVSSPSTEPMM